MTTNRAHCLVPVLCAVFASVRGIHIHSASASHLGNQTPLQGRETQRSFNWFTPSGDSNVVVRQWQSARQSETAPWGQSWSWSWNTGTGSNPPQNPDPTWPPPPRGATADRNLNTRPRNGGIGTPSNGNSLSMRPNEILKTVQNVKMPSFSRNHLKAASLPIQRALTDMVTNWFSNGGSIAKKQMQSLVPKSTVTTKQKSMPLVTAARDVSMSPTVRKLAPEPSTPAVQTPLTREPAPSPSRHRMTEELLPTAVVHSPPESANVDNILPSYTNTISKHRTKLIGRRKIVKFVNNVKIPTFRRSHLRGDSQSIQRALVKAVTGWAGYIAPGISGSTIRTANKPKSDRRRVKESRKRNIPTVTNQWDIPPPPIPIPAPERTNMQPIPVSVQKPPKQQQQQPPPKPFTNAHPPPIPLPPTNSGPTVGGRLRDDAAGSFRPRSEARDTQNKRRAYIIPIAIIRNSPNRAGSTQQQRPRDANSQRRRKPRPKPRYPSDSFLTALLFSLPRGSFPRSMRADLSGQMAPRRGDATPRTPHQVYTEEPGEEMEL